MKIRAFRVWNWWPINRPRFYAERWDDKKVGIWVDWGNGNSDPVWTLGVEITFGKDEKTE